VLFVLLAIVMFVLLTIVLFVLLVIALFVFLRFTASDCPFGILKRFGKSSIHDPLRIICVANDKYVPFVVFIIPSFLPSLKLITEYD